MGIADLTSAFAKLRRANEHLDALQAEIGLVINQKITVTTPVEFRQDGRWHVVEVDFSAFIGDTRRWATIMGDVINNTRAALDHTVWQLVLREDKKPQKSNYFPLITERQKFLNEVEAPPKDRKKRSALYGIPIGGDAWTIIKNAQPYRRPEPETDPLALLRRFSNIDKHQALLVGHKFMKASDLFAWLKWKPGLQPVERIDGVTPLLPKGPTEICRLRFSDPDPGMYVQGQIPIYPTFGDHFSQIGFGRFRDMPNWATEIVNQISHLPRVELGEP